MIFDKNVGGENNISFSINCNKSITELYIDACDVLKIDDLKVLLTPWEYDERFDKVFFVCLEINICSCF
jgi:hypothetical protein